MKLKLDFPPGNRKDEANDMEKIRGFLDKFNHALNKPTNWEYSEPPKGKYADWEELNKFLDLIENDPIFQTTDLAVQMHEQLLKHDIATADSGFHWPYNNANTASQKVVLLMGNNPENLEYLKSIFNEQKMPEDARFSFDDMESGDQFLPSYYYVALIHALAKIKTPEVIRFIEQMLLKIDQQNDAYFREQKQIILGDDQENNREIQEEVDENLDENEVEVFNYEKWFGSPLERYEKGDHFSAKSNYKENGYNCVGFKEEAIKILGEIGDEKTINTFRQFIINQRGLSPIFFDDLLSVFRKLDQTKSVSMLLGLARSGEETIKKNALALLYRMEAGKIGVSEDGVHYLQKVYDIGSFNGPAYYYAQRITRGGQVGIFEQKSEKFQKYFELVGLDSEQTNIKAQLLDLTYETLFVSKVLETDEQKKEREHFLAEFQEKYFGFLNGEFFDIAGVRFNDLSFEEQAQFMMFYEKSDETTQAEVVDFCKKFGLNGFRVFLSLDQGEYMGENLLKIGDLYQKEVAVEIFAKYLEIANVAENIEEYVDMLCEQATQISRTDVVCIRDNLLKKAKDLLVSYSSLKVVNNKPKQNLQILAQLEHIRAEVLLFASTFKVLSKEEKIGLTDLQGTHFEIKDASELTGKEKEAMTIIFNENRENYPDELRKETLMEFKQVLQESNHEFQVLHFNDDIVAFVRFDILENGNFYAGSLNVQPVIRGSTIGSAMLHATLDKKAEERDVEAIVYENNPMLDKYLTEYGFERVKGEKGIINNYKETGQTFYRIIKKKTKKDQTPTSNTSAFSQAV